MKSLYIKVFMNNSSVLNIISNSGLDCWRSEINDYGIVKQAEECLATTGHESNNHAMSSSNHCRIAINIIAIDPEGGPASAD